MNDFVTDEMVEAVAKRLDPDAWAMTAGVYQESHGRHYGNAESFIQSARQTARGEARAILRLVAPLIAAKAWEEGYAACRNRPRVDGYLINRANPYQTRADAIERGES